MGPLRAEVAASTKPTLTIVRQLQALDLRRKKSPQTEDGDHSSSRWSIEHLVHVRFRDSDMILGIYYHRDDAAVLGPSHFHVETTMRDASRQDPRTSFNFGLNLTFEQKLGSGGLFMTGYVHLLSAKPSHGVMKGTDALGTAVALGRWFGLGGLELTDLSNKACPSGKGELPLRRTLILSKGQGWYESQGFRSVVEIVEPGVFKKHVPLLHRMSIDTLHPALQAALEALQDALIHHRTHQSFGQLTILEYVRHLQDPTVHAAPSKPVSMDTLVSTLRQVSTPATALRRRSGTLGKVVDQLIEEDCATASEVVEGLLPSSSSLGFFVVTRDVEGKPVRPQLPQLAAWVYTWRVVNSFPDMYLDISSF
jgi:hypothetical protein